MPGHLQVPSEELKAFISKFRHLVLGAQCSGWLELLSINFSYFPNLPDLSCCGSSRI